MPSLSGPELALIIVAALGSFGAVIAAVNQLVKYLGEGPERKAAVAATDAATESVKAGTAEKLVGAAEQMMNAVAEQQKAAREEYAALRKKVDDVKDDSNRQLQAIADANTAQVRLLTDSNAAQVKAIEAEAADLRAQVVGLKEQVSALLMINTDLRSQVTELTAHGKVLEDAAKTQRELVAQFAAMKELLNRVASGVSDVKDEQAAVAKKVGNGDSH